MSVYSNPLALAALSLAAACGNVQDHAPDGGGGGPIDGSGGGSEASHLPECTAQRAVYLVGGTGGFAWFTLEWPLPAVITGFQSTYAFDDPTLVGDVTNGQIAHPLYARKIGARTLWQGLGTAPEPSAIIAGNNETHTQIPSSIVGSPQALPGLGATLQTALKPTIAGISFSASATYGVATTAASVSAAVQLFAGTLSAAQQAQLTPSADQLSRYVPAGGTNGETAFGTELAFAANAFKLGVVTTVIIPAFLDDPHGVFASGTTAVTARANNLAAMLDAFYTDLAAADDPSCSHAGAPIKLADNTLLAAFGDTPKNSFTANGWPDGTEGNSNWIYLRSNGFLKPGWFGVVTSAARQFFDPTTGLTDASATAAADTSAAYAATLYALVRGNAAKVTAVTTSAYAGLVLK